MSASQREKQREEVCVRKRVAMSLSAPPAQVPGSTLGPLPRTWAPIAFGGVAAPQEVEGVVVVEAGGAWAARKVATASRVALISGTPCGAEERSEGGEGLSLDWPTAAAVCPFAAPASLEGPHCLWGSVYIWPKTHFPVSGSMVMWLSSG